MSPYLVMQVAGSTAAWTRIWFRLFEADRVRRGADRPPRFPTEQEDSSPRTSLKQTAADRHCRRILAHKSHGSPTTQKGLKPVGSADRCPLADTGHNGICRGFVKGSISVCGGLKGLHPVGRPSLKARRSRMTGNPEPIETASRRPSGRALRRANKGHSVSRSNDSCRFVREPCRGVFRQ
jgi:hypothetical protein